MSSKTEFGFSKQIISIAYFCAAAVLSVTTGYDRAFAAGPGISFEFATIRITGTSRVGDTADISFTPDGQHVVARLNQASRVFSKSEVWGVSFVSEGGSASFSNLTDIPAHVDVGGGRNKVYGNSAFYTVVLRGDYNLFEAGNSAAYVTIENGPHTVVRGRKAFVISNYTTDSHYFIPTPVPPAAIPTVVPTVVPPVVPTLVPTVVPTVVPPRVPTAAPTIAPTARPTVAATSAPGCRVSAPGVSLNSFGQVTIDTDTSSYNTVDVSTAPSGKIKVVRNGACVEFPAAGVIQITFLGAGDFNSYQNNTTVSLHVNLAGTGNQVLGQPGGFSNVIFRKDYNHFDSRGGTAYVTLENSAHSEIVAYGNRVQIISNYNTDNFYFM